ncbi:MAG: host attachment protein, partial [Pseudomonadota bacterium]
MIGDSVCGDSRSIASGALVAATVMIMGRSNIMKIKDKVWVLVADGGKALVLKNIGTPMTPDFEVVRQARLSTPPTRMMGRDRPGRRLDGSAPHRSSMEAPDLHERAEERFLSEQLDALERDKASNRFAS